MIWSDGVNRTKPVLFTYDKRFRTAPPNTTRRRELHQRLMACLEENGLTADQVVVLPGNKTFVRESPAILRSYLAMVQIPVGCRVLHDCGRAFFEKGESVIEQCCNVQTATYPPAIHHYLSPNDNRLHGAAKGKWRGICAELGWGKDKVVEGDTFLLGVLTRASSQAICGYFQRNILWARGTPTLRRCKAWLSLMGKGRIVQNRYFGSCTRSYRRFTSHYMLRRRMSRPSHPPNL